MYIDVHCTSSSSLSACTSICIPEIYPKIAQIFHLTSDLVHPLAPWSSACTHSVRPFFSRPKPWPGSPTTDWVYLVSICINGACCNRIAHNAHRGNTTQAPAVAPNSNTETSAAHSQCCLHSIARPSVQPYFIKIFFPMSDSKALPKAGVGCWRHGMTRDDTGRSSVGHGRSPAQQGSCNCCLDV